MASLENIEREFRDLLSQEGRLRFLAKDTGLAMNRIVRLVKFVDQVPLAGEEMDFGRQAQEAGVEISQFMLAMNPLIAMCIQDKEAEYRRFKEAFARGETPELPPEVEALNEHIVR